MIVRRKPFVKTFSFLERVFLKAEKEIYGIVKKQRANNLVDFSSVAQLEKVQNILADMTNKSFKYIPIAVEKQYKKGRKQYLGKSQDLTDSDIEICKRLESQLENMIVKSSIMAESQFLYGWQKAMTESQQTERVAKQKRNNRLGTIKAQIESSATGGLVKASEIFEKDLREHGLTAFIDKAGRRHRLSSYCNMATRTIALQTRNISMIDNDWDLYQISKHNSSCPICKQYEGRVYSKSGTNPNYPPLASAFGKIDKNGSNTLENTYLCIHPNCWHTLLRYTERGKSEKEIKQMQQFSSFKSNPPSANKYNKKEIQLWQQKTKGEARLNEDFKQWERYRSVLGAKIPHFTTFLKHKLKNSAKYKEWKNLYRKYAK